MKKKEKFIVFEGIDGTGKSTQAQLLLRRLKKEGYKVASIHFPQYQKKSAGLIQEYLAGRYGKIGPYQASVLYAADRYDASFRIREWLKKGYVVIADRYIGSNIGHQGGKIKNAKSRAEYFKWLYNFEYNILGIPKPTVSFILKVLPAIAQSLRKKVILKKKKDMDIHEKDIVHLKNAEKAYLVAANMFPKYFLTINCMSSGKLLSRDVIHKKIWSELKRFL